MFKILTLSRLTPSEPIHGTREEEKKKVPLKPLKYLVCVTKGLQYIIIWSLKTSSWPAWGRFRKLQKHA